MLRHKLLSERNFIAIWGKPFGNFWGKFRAKGKEYPLDNITEALDNDFFYVFFYYFKGGYMIKILVEFYQIRNIAMRIQ